MRNRSVIFLSLLWSIFCGSAWALVVPVQDLISFEQELSRLDENALVLLDVDYTLIVPKDKILRNSNKQLLQQLSREILNNPKIMPEDKYAEDYLSSTVLFTAKHTLIDPQSVSLVKSIQKKGIKIIALTAASTGVYGVIPSMEDWRIDDLRGLGFDFTLAFPKFKIVTFPEYNDVDSPPLFKEGVLFSGGYPKGHVLKTFLNKIQWKPKKVIFIDDNMSFIRSVEMAMTAAGIEFLGFHYKAAANLPCKVNIEVAELQIRTLAQHGLWLSDDQAEALLLLGKAPKTSGIKS